MIPGYNHNVKYKDKVYHVQTEDSGVANPHVITHLFVGGNIVESRKTSYAHLVSNAQLGDQLVEIMQAQHKGMLKDLIGGKFDSKILERSKNAATLNGPAPLNVDAGAQHRASFGLPVDPKTAAAAKAATPPATAPAAPPRPAPKPVLPSAGAYARAVESGAPGRTDNPFAVPPRPPPGPVGSQPAQRAAAAAAAAGAAPAAKGAPPTFGGLPPKSGAQRAAGTPAAITRPVPAPAPAAPAPPGAAAAAAPAGEVLEAETLARAFESNESAVDSIFGEDLISEKSLDEVILSYLAGDGER